MIKYFLYLLLIFCVIKIFRFKLNSDDNIIYPTLSILIGIAIINWLIPKYHKMTPEHSSQKDNNQSHYTPVQSHYTPDQSHYTPVQSHYTPDQSHYAQC